MESESEQQREHATKNNINSNNNSIKSNTSSSVIIPIAQSDIRRIVAGQAVSDIASAVKELVDNALDAGATSINVRLFNQGLDVIEVTDNGCGVPKLSRHLLATKNATSKIRSFDEIYKEQHNQIESSGGNDDDDDNNGGDGNDTLGFRGEALFSLSSISKGLIVSTRCAGEDIGQRMEFGRDGSLIINKNDNNGCNDGFTDVPRKVGTTVAVVALFDSLPVRRADLKKRITAQRSKLWRLMQSYAILKTGIRWNVADVIGGPVGTGGSGGGDGSSRTDTKLETSGRGGKSGNGGLVRFGDTVSSVLGSRFLGGMCEVNVDLGPIFETNTEPPASSSPPSSSFSTSPWKVEGLVSMAPNATLISNTYSRSSDSKNRRKNATSSASVARDVQFFSINGRPVEMPCLSRTVLEVWRIFDTDAVADNSATSSKVSTSTPSKSSRKKKPACIINLALPGGAYDINIAADKRTVLMGREDDVCNALRVKLEELWSGQTDGRFELDQVSGSNMDCRLSSDGDGDEHAVTKMAIEHLSNNPVVRKDEGEDKVLTQQQKQQSSQQQSSQQQSLLSQSKTQTHNSQQQNRGRMKRRNAFVHDFGRVGPLLSDRELHELNEIDGENLIESENQVIEETQVMTKVSSPISEQQPHDDSLNESEKMNGASVADEAIIKGVDMEKLSMSSSLHQFKDEGISLLEERRWSQLKLKFNHRNKSDDRNNNSQMEEIDTLLSINDDLYNKEKGDNGIDTLTPVNNTVSEGDNESSNHESKDDGYVGSKKRKLLKEGEKSDERRNNESGQDNAKLGTHTVVLPVARQIVTEDEQICEKGELKKLKYTKPETVATTTIWEEIDSTNDVIQSMKSSRLKNMRVSRNIDRTHKQQVESLNGKVSDCNKSVKGEVYDVSNSGGMRAVGGDQNVSLSKEDFLTMTILGQFNLGFILAMCKKNHLWILDQHACDEQFNFERHIRDTVMHEQKLIAPLPLELSPSEESCIVDNIEIFKRNGFCFDYNIEKPPRHRLSLTALPHSGSGADGRRAVQFGKEDVGALCAMLNADGDSGASSYGNMAGSGTGADGRGSMGNNAVRRHASGTISGSGTATIRLPKAIAMFASRACRGSIMIGEPLSMIKMKEVVQRLHDVDQPWTCPHGRPTMRHVKQLVVQLYQDEVENSKIVVPSNLANYGQKDIRRSTNAEQKN